jgi:hypothetical protein
MQLGQVLNVDAGGVGTAGSDGIPGTITFLNSKATLFTCGLSLPDTTNPAPICASPLYGNNIQCIVPTRQIFLMFSTQPIAPGQMIARSTGQGLLANFAAAGAQALKVTYNINEGWTWGGFAWGNAYPPLTNLQHLLVQEPNDAALRAERMWRERLIPPWNSRQDNKVSG